MADVVRFDLSETVHLRLPTPADTDELWAVTVANQAHLARWMPWAVAKPRREQTAEWIAAVGRQAASDNGFQCVVDDGGRLAGCIGFHRVDWINGVTSIGYWLAADAQGRGTMTAAVRALLAHAFGTWGLHRVVIEAAPDNRRSRAIPERLGFTEEGLLRETEVVGERRLDHVVYGMLAREWRSGR